MMNLKTTSDINLEFIENSIQQGLEFALGDRETFDGDLKNMYFAGATLCLDLKDEFNDVDVITICHSDETFGYFSGNCFRRLLNINSLKKLEKLMCLCEIKHKSKWNVKN